MNALLTLSLVVILDLLLGAALSLTAYLGLRAFRRVLEHQSPEQRAALYAAAVLVPPIAVALVAAASLGRPGGLHRWTGHIDASWLACLSHFRTCSLVVGGAAGLAAAVLVVGVRHTVMALTSTVQLARRLSEQWQSPSPKLRHAASCAAAGGALPVRIGEADGTQPISLVFGLRRPRCLFSRTLVAAATPDELVGIVAHELAHVHRHDNLQKLVLRLAAAFQGMLPWVSALMQQWQLEVELACDDRAVSAIGGCKPLATALLKVALPAGPPPATAQNCGVRRVQEPVMSGFGEGGAAAVRTRIERLIDPSPRPVRRGVSAPPSPRAWMKGVALAAVGSAALLVWAVMTDRLAAPWIASLVQIVGRYCR